MIEIDRTKPRFNCANCGSFVTVPAHDYPDTSDGAVPRIDLECPRCRSVYSLASATAWTIALELSVVQNEYDRPKPGSKRVKPRRAAIYADPIYGPIRRAQDRLKAAQRDLELRLADAHVTDGRSVREIALSAGISKSRTHELIKLGAVRLDSGESVDSVPSYAEGEIVF